MLGRTTIAGAISIALLGLLVVASCGKKGPPRPPPRLIPAPISDLRARQTDDRLVLEMTYPAVTTSGLALPAVEALEVLTLRPRSVGGVAPNVEPAMFAVSAVVTKRLEGAELQAATRGGELVVELDAAVGSPLGPMVESVATPPATAATSTPAPTAGPTATAPAPQTTPSPTVAPPAASTVLLAVRTFGPRHNESPLSNLVAITPHIAPSAPPTLALTATAAGVKLEWTAEPAGPLPAAAPPIGYDVLRRRAGEGSFADRIAQLGADRLDHVDDTAVYGEHYEYTVRSIAARDPVVESGDGPVRDLEYRDTFAPPTPTGLVALAEEGRIRLLWDRVEAPDLAGYRLYRQENGGAEVELPRDPGAGTDHTDDQVRAGVTYRYRVSAVDREENESAKSEPATATPR
jgi:predicted small lipoprotein YifL